MTTTAPKHASPPRLDRWWLTATGSVAVAVLLASTLSPDLVSGTPPDQIPLAALLDWFWGSIAIAYLAAAGPGRADPTLAVSVVLLWFAIAATSIFAPSLVTGSDPTTVPVAALVAPVVGAITTGFLAIAAVRRTSAG